MRETVIIDSPAGKLSITASLCGIQELRAAPDDATLSQIPVHMQPWIRSLNAYFSGADSLRSIPLDMQGGTALQQRVWDALCDIPNGTTLTYSQLAETVGKSAAVRAVASACGKNPVAIIVPCHRVLAKDGSLGGYAYGLPMKRALLAIESGERARKAA